MGKCGTEMGEESSSSSRRERERGRRRKSFENDRRGRDKARRIKWRNFTNQ